MANVAAPPKPGTQFPRKVPTSRNKMSIILGLAIFVILMLTVIAVDILIKN